MTPEWYEIRVEGELSADWSDWFGGLDIHPSLSGDSVLSGYVADQSVLHGVLATIRDLNLKLISVSRRSQGQINDGHQEIPQSQFSEE